MPYNQINILLLLLFYDECSKCGSYKCADPKWCTVNEKFIGAHKMQKECNSNIRLFSIAPHKVIALPSSWYQ